MGCNCNCKKSKKKQNLQTQNIFDNQEEIFKNSEFDDNNLLTDREPPILHIEKSKIEFLNSLYFKQYNCDLNNQENIFIQFQNNKNLLSESKKQKDFCIFLYFLINANNKELLNWINNLLLKFCKKQSLALDFKEFQE